jgi:hypothetical protein
MDLNSVETVITPRSRAELPNFSQGTVILGGGTQLFLRTTAESSSTQLGRFVAAEDFRRSDVEVDAHEHLVFERAGRVCRSAELSIVALGAAGVFEAVAAAASSATDR